MTKKAFDTVMPLDMLKEGYQKYKKNFLLFNFIQY